MKQPTEYQLWKEGHLLTLRAFTEEEIFNFGFDAGRAYEVEAMVQENKLAEKAIKQTNAKSKIQKDSAPE